MKLVRYIFIATLLVILTPSCQKEVEEPYEPLVFTNITASSTSFSPGTYVALNAHATGTGLTFHWSYNSGSLSGSGSNVNYTSEEPGSHKVLCTVVDSEGSIDSKEITLYVQ